MAVHWFLVEAEERGPAGVKPGELSDDALSHRLRLLERLVHEERLVKRITGSDNSEARRMLAEAQDMWEQAEVRYEVGNHTAAAEFTRQGLAAVTAASRLVGDAGRKNEHDRSHYEKLRKRVLSFSEAFQRVVVEKPGQGIPALLDRDKVSGLLHEAEGLAVQGDYEGAGRQASVAASIVEQALASARDRDTLLHELSFATPKDEYEYEKQRNMSYRLLVNMLESEKTVNSTALAQVRAAVEENDAIRSLAEQMAQRGDLSEAIRQLEQGTDQLARVLRMSGLVF
jgi:hypothetical protein